MSLTIPVRCLERPRYDNADVRSFCAWQGRNLDALRRYYADLGRSLPTSDMDGLTATGRAQAFLQFCLVQWDRERYSLDDVSEVVPQPAPGPHAIANARQAAMLVEEDREACR